MCVHALNRFIGFLWLHFSATNGKIILGIPNSLTFNVLATLVQSAFRFVRNCLHKLHIKNWEICPNICLCFGRVVQVLALSEKLCSVSPKSFQNYSVSYMEEFNNRYF